MQEKYTVQKGDTLSEIAAAFLSQSGFSKIYDYVKELVKINDIKNPNYIVVGQVIKLYGESTASKPTTSSRVTVNVFGLQSNTDRTMYITWSWSREHTKNYKVIWYYDTGDNVWFIGNDSDTEDTQSLYSAPSNALRVKVKIKPVSETHKVNDVDTEYWVGSWSTEKTYSFSSNPPTTPPTPSVEVTDFKLTAELTNLKVNATSIQFQIVRDDQTVFNTGTAKIVTNSASYSCTLAAGAKYKVRCRSVRGNLYSEWSDYSDNHETIPSTPSEITICRASSETSVYLEWASVPNAVTYDVEYTTKLTYFDVSDQTSNKNGIEFTRYEITGLTSGEEYFFRVRAVNEKGHSGWSTIKSVKIGKAPAAPTTWSSTTTAKVGEDVILYWVHNSEDESRQTFADIELYINGVKETYTIRSSEEDEDEKIDRINSYVIDTSKLSDGTKIQWRVRTSGISNEYGDWSIQRTIDVYAPPTLELNLIKASGETIETINSFPFYLSALPWPKTQLPIGYHVVVSAKSSYDTVDNMGNTKHVSVGEQIYSKYFDISQELMLEFSAGNLSLENNVGYIVTCVVSMNSGLTAESSCEFNVAWDDNEHEPNAEISIDRETFSAFIRPYCVDENGELLEGILLSVYRREFDGGFTELAKDLDNLKCTYITDPHPALDYARYRIVAKTVDTGTISYCDLAGYPVGGTSIVIQWDEDWSSFNASEESELEQRPWTGSLLKLPYNVDVSDNNNPDVELVEYIGRKYPVSYYGTQVGSTSTWNVTIEKDDEETVYALRRLSMWMGDVYVREPSGSGYWAHITVSFSQKHSDVIIPVTLSITRVAGGI